MIGSRADGLWIGVIVGITRAREMWTSQPWGGVLVVAICAAFVGCESGGGIDYGMNSSNVAQHLVRDENFPFVGFWKVNPDDDVGLVINKAPDGKYGVWWCSPRGAVEVESLSPTTLVNDENFRIVDDGTIEVLDKAGGRFTSYVRSE